jgi:hypothetical protein
LQQQQSFKHSIRSNVPIHVASALQGRWIIGGSDDGSVRVFDQRTADVIKCLRHGESKNLYRRLLQLNPYLFLQWKPWFRLWQLV